MKIFVVGAAKVGKSSVARMLGDCLSLPVGETGDVLIEQLARVNAGRAAARCDGQTLKNWFLKIMCRKDSYRSQLAALGDLMTAIDPRCLVWKCAESAKIIVGVRRRREVIPFVLKGAERKNIWIKVRGPQRGNITPDVFELAPYDFDYEVNNFGDLTWLKKNVVELAAKIAGRMQCA